MKSLIAVCLALTTSLNAATIAIVDSGVDTTHSKLKNNIWKNDQGQVGWNFAENNDKIFDPDVLATFSPNIKRLLEINDKARFSEMSESDKAWAIEQMKLANTKDEIERFGIYVHGTHVAGIASEKSSHKIMSIKLIPTPVKKTILEGLKLKIYEYPTSKGSPQAVSKEDLDKTMIFILTRLAFQSSSNLKAVTKYVSTNGVHVANGSFIVGIFQAVDVVIKVYETVFKKTPTEREAIQWANLFNHMCVEVNEITFASAPKTLFVFASGNDGLNNDFIFASPANVRIDNTITVAATYQDMMLAPFSNYGVKMVDVAAPGMLINSTIPGNGYLTASGTSQAAPFVSNVAGKVYDINPELSPKDIKKILMGTVDKKDFLKDKVVSGGVVNPRRAISAAMMSAVVGVDEAITRSFTAVPVKKSSKGLMMEIPKDFTLIPLAPIFI